MFLWEVEFFSIFHKRLPTLKVIGVGTAGLLQSRHNGHSVWSVSGYRLVEGNRVASFTQKAPARMKEERTLRLR